ncbi:hypothetical protein DEU56DRAFT_504192 [Suillus clintonianus]|uniref:uncharacterized protein n=1 Tax=Suillus clintonianus TaxID=1904413 RepID=UPI001B8751E6|nr:uncharacterized protein DEU56DRAFT_504192 [Suillus clintonianus]KAG2128692.1 hypothetical protein DEU56DRAFT_504192 [Suillus clintonianus]
MPHKRAKRAVREREKSLKGVNLPPKHLGNEDTVPKSVSRILNAEKIRHEFREKKRKIDEPNGDGSPQPKRRRPTSDVNSRKEEMLKIKPGETIAHFNKRVESSMMPLIRTAMQQSSAQVRRVQKHEIEQGVAKSAPAQVKTIIKKASRADVSNSLTPTSTNTPPSHADVANISPLTSTNTPQRQPRDKPKEFRVSSTSAPRRLNDIAQEPPRFGKLPRGAQSGKDSSKEKVAGILSMAQKAMMEEERENVIKRYRELKAKKLRSDGSGAVGG